MTKKMRKIKFTLRFYILLLIAGLLLIWAWPFFWDARAVSAEAYESKLKNLAEGAGYEVEVETKQKLEEDQATAIWNIDEKKLTVRLPGEDANLPTVQVKFLVDNAIQVEFSALHDSEAMLHENTDSTRQLSWTIDGFPLSEEESVLAIKVPTDKRAGGADQIQEVEIDLSLEGEEKTVLQALRNRAKEKADKFYSSNEGANLLTSNDKLEFQPAKEALLGVLRPRYGDRVKSLLNLEGESFLTQLTEMTGKYYRVQSFGNTVVTPANSGEVSYHIPASGIRKYQLCGTRKSKDLLFQVKARTLYRITPYQLVLPENSKLLPQYLNEIRRSVRKQVIKSSLIEDAWVFKSLGTSSYQRHFHLYPVLLSLQGADTSERNTFRNKYRNLFMSKEETVNQYDLILQSKSHYHRDYAKCYTILCLNEFRSLYLTATSEADQNNQKTAATLKEVIEEIIRDFLKEQELVLPRDGSDLVNERSKGPRLDRSVAALFLYTLMDSLDRLDPPMDGEFGKTIQSAIERLESYLLQRSALGSSRNPGLRYVDRQRTNPRITLYPGYLLAKVSKLRREESQQQAVIMREEIIRDILESGVIESLVEIDENKSRARWLGSYGFNYLAWALRELVDEDLSESQTLWGTENGQDLIPLLRKLGRAVSKVSSNSNDESELMILDRINTDDKAQYVTTFKLTTLALLEEILSKVE